MQLTVEQIEQGRRKALANGKELLEEARLLFIHGKFARSYTLAHICREELAKIPMLVRIGQQVAMSMDPDWPRFWKRFRSHSQKIRNIHTLNYYPSEIRPGDQDFFDYLDALDTTPQLNDRKNTSLYCEFSSDSFQSLSDQFDEQTTSVFLIETESIFNQIEAVELATCGKLDSIVKSPEFIAFESAMNLFREHSN